MNCISEDTEADNLYDTDCVVSTSTDHVYSKEWHTWPSFLTISDIIDMFEGLISHCYPDSVGGVLLPVRGYNRRPHEDTAMVDLCDITLPIIHAHIDEPYRYTKSQISDIIGAIESLISLHSVGGILSLLPSKIQRELARCIYSLFSQERRAEFSETRTSISPYYPPLEVPYLAIGVRDHFGGLFSIPMYLCTSWMDFKRVVEYYYQSVDGGDVIKRDDWELVRITDNEVINKSDFISTLEPGMEFGIRFAVSTEAQMFSALGSRIQSHLVHSSDAISYDHSSDTRVSATFSGSEMQASFPHANRDTQTPFDRDSNEMRTSPTHSANSAPYSDTLRTQPRGMFHNSREFSIFDSQFNDVQRDQIILRDNHIEILGFHHQDEPRLFNTLNAFQIGVWARQWIIYAAAPNGRQTINLFDALSDCWQRFVGHAGTTVPMVAAAGLAVAIKAVLSSSNTAVLDARRGQMLALGTR